MANNAQKIGWIGMGRMGFPMAERLLKAGYDVSIWNRTRSKAEPLAAKGGKIVDNLSDLEGGGRAVLNRVDRQGPRPGAVRQEQRRPATGASCRRSSSTARPSRSRNSASIRDRLKQLGSDFVAAPISGNAKVIKAGGCPRCCPAPKRRPRPSRR